MPNVTYYHLAQRGGLHVGERGVEQEETRVSAPSDTLYSALYAAWVEAYGDAGAWERAFGAPDGPPLLIGSAYPRAGDVRFYPLPRVDVAARGVGAGQPKALRRIAYVSEGIWRRIVAGRGLPDVSPLDASGDGLFLQGGALWLARDEASRLPDWTGSLTSPSGRRRPRPLEALRHVAIYRTHRAPRVTVDRVSQAGSIYHTGRCVYAPECGLWFPVLWRRPEAALEGGLSCREGLERALSLLCDAGLGGERAAGLGACDWSAPEDTPWKTPRPGQPMALLSRYYPREGELPAAIQGPHVRYGLASVAGYLRSPQAASQRRRRLWLFAEGSVLSATQGVMGGAADVRPLVGAFPHPVWRCGWALGARMEAAHG